MTPEGKVKKEIKEWLREVEHAYFFMPVQVGYGSTTLDFLTCINGHFIGIETKRPGLKNPTPRQRICMDAIERAGGWAFCVDSLDDLLYQYINRRNEP